MFQVGPLELLVVGIIALLVLGPARLPDAARAVGKGVREFRGALDMSDDDEEAAERKRSDEADSTPA
jgi:sec-independent protein translocase protein TatA